MFIVALFFSFSKTRMHLFSYAYTVISLFRLNAHVSVGRLLSFGSVSIIIDVFFCAKITRV